MRKLKVLSTSTRHPTSCLNACHSLGICRSKQIESSYHCVQRYDAWGSVTITPARHAAALDREITCHEHRPCSDMRPRTLKIAAAKIAAAKVATAKIAAIFKSRFLLLGCVLLGAGVLIGAEIS